MFGAVYLYNALIISGTPNGRLKHRIPVVSQKTENSIEPERSERRKEKIIPLFVGSRFKMTADRQAKMVCLLGDNAFFREGAVRFCPGR